MKKIILSAATAVLLSTPALALDGYSTETQNLFTGWCTGEGYTAKVCGCALDQSMVQIPAVAMTSFLTAAEGEGTAAMSTSVGVSAVQIVTTCAATSSSGSSGTGNAVNALGGMFGK
ncbi:hypothetical protein V5T82_09380 [Magnetovibrio sp. PR-2]|uniref:hypothetical protein n=1 Tax=Magnetovibrio sp. PR-2 TaxID=3120356 RepID=UPI002FCE3B18